MKIAFLKTEFEIKTIAQNGSGNREGKHGN